MVETTPLNIEAVKLDDEREVDAFHEAWIDTGQAKVQDDFLRLRELGIVDANGNQLTSIVVFNTDPLVNGYYWAQVVTPVPLTVGATYTVADQVNANGWGYGQGRRISNSL